MATVAPGNEGFSTLEHWAEVEGQTVEQYKSGGAPPSTSAGPIKPPEVHKPTEPKPEAPQVAVGIQANTKETVDRDKFDQLNREAPLLAGILRDQGYQAYLEADKEFRTRGSEREAAAKDELAKAGAIPEKWWRKTPDETEIDLIKAVKEGVSAKAIADAGFDVSTEQYWEVKSQINAQKTLDEYNVITEDGKLNLTAAAEDNVPISVLNKAGYLVTQKDLDAALESGKPKYTLAPGWSISKIPEAEKQAETLGAKRGDWWYKEKQISNDEREKLIADFEARRDQLIKDGKMFTPEWDNLGENPANATSRVSGIADTVKAILESPPEAPQYWYKGTLIDQAQRDALIKQSEANRDYISRASTKKQREIATFAADVIVPGFYTVRNWDDLSAGEKAVNIGLDLLILAPIAGAATRGARAVSTAGKWERIGAAARAVGEEALAQGKAPFYMAVHPVQTAKGLARQAAHITEMIVDPRKLKEAVITTTSGTTRLKVSQATSEAEAEMIRDKLVKLAQRGERPVVEINGVKYELARSPLMRELGGGLAHATGQGEIFTEGLKVAPKPGMSKAEQGLFVSPEPLPRFAGVSAFGKTGEKSIIYITSPQTAEKLSVATGKLYKAPAEGLVAEMERKFPIGAELPKPKQKLTFRTGADLQKVEVWLEKPLTVKQLAKLKVEGFIEEVKTIFRPAISITGTAKKGAVTTGNMKALASIIDDTAANRVVARALERNAAEVVNISRAITDTRVDRMNALNRTGAERAAPEVRVDTKEARIKAEAERERIEARKPAETVRVEAPERRVPERVTGRQRVARETVNREMARQEIRREDLTRSEQRALDRMERQRETARTDRTRERAERNIRDLTERARQRIDRESTPARRGRNVREGERARIETERGRIERGRDDGERIIRDKKGRAGDGKGFPGDATEKEKRAIIQSASGAVAWRQGQLGGKDVWHVILFPYDKKPYHTTLVGNKPQGASVAEGPESAYKTAQRLAGLPPNRRVDIDMGITDIALQPGTGEKQVKLEFTPDPMGKTKGDFSIGSPRISKMPRLSRSVPKLR